MGTPPGKRGKGEPPSKQEVFKQYQARRSVDGFENDGGPSVGAAWKSFVGERGQRLKTVMQGFRVLGNPKYPPGTETSLTLVRDVLTRWGTPVPALPPPRFIEWMLSMQGGRPLGWREVPSGLAQIAANEGRTAVVLGSGLEVVGLGAIVYPDEAASAPNPTVLMVTETLALDPGTVLQGFRGQPVRYFSNGQ
jgi:hypothetical protein